VSRPTVFSQLLHDLGGAAWFGGSLMGLAGVNGAADAVSDPTERPRVAAAGWGRWAPLNFVAVGAHVIGGLGLVIANRDRVAKQAGVRSNSIIKTIVTLLALAATAYSGLLGAKVAKAGNVPASGSVEPNSATPDEVADAQRQLRALQYALPALTGTIVGLGAQQSQQQRPELQAEGRFRRLVNETTSRARG